MTKDQIKTAVIKKVKANGYDVEISGTGRINIFNGKDEAEETIPFEVFILTHKFAQAFWKLEEDAYVCDCNPQHWYSHKYCSKCGKKLKKKKVDLGSWRRNIQQMVLEEDRFQYLKNSL